MSGLASPVIRLRLQHLVDVDDDASLPLARAALLIAQEEYPCLDRVGYERKIESMAQAVRDRVSGSAEGERKLAAINDEMFNIERFHGNTSGYYDPRNSYLSDVLDRKLGIPISLSIIYLELCWRTGVAAVGVGLPGHFIVLVDVGELFYVDPFDRGARLSIAACEEKFRQVHGPTAQFRPAMLAPLGRRQILFRLLANLKNIYINHSDYGRALAAVDRMLMLDPMARGELRDRGFLNAKIGFFGQACADYQSFLRAAPPVSEAQNIQQALATMMGKRAWRN